LAGAPEGGVMAIKSGNLPNFGRYPADRQHP
jgi:hypothetical protein